MKNYRQLEIAERESLSWTSLAGESIFITGGSGFFGTALLYSFLEANRKKELNIKVTVLTRSISTFSNKHPKLVKSKYIKLLEGDVVNFNFPSEKFSKIFHLATTTAAETYNGESQLNKYKVLTDGTERVLQFAGKCNAKKIVFTSSGVVYGELPRDMKSVNESYLGAPDTTRPSSALAQGKRTAEFLISYYSEMYGFDYVIARCFSFVGPFLPMELHYAIGNFVFDALYKEEIKIKSDGSSYRSYMDVNDLTVWLLSFMSTKCEHKIYNVGSDQALSISDLAKKIRDILSPNKKIIIQGDISHSVGNFSRNYYVPNINRAKNELNLDTWIGLDLSIRRIGKANKSNE